MEPEHNNGKNLRTKFGNLASLSRLKSIGELRSHGLDAFTQSFDKHFETNSSSIQENLARIRESLKTDSCTDTNDFTLAKTPQYWGLKVRFIKKIWEYIADDINGYTASHFLDEDLNHVCLLPHCNWNHAGAKHLSKTHAHGRLSAMPVNMHLVVQRYVKPWTLVHCSYSLALLLNAGWFTKYRRKNNTVDSLCKATVFVSHNWGDLFEGFVDTLTTVLDPDTVVWVCSFSIPQHMDVAGMLSKVETCPFAVALQCASRIVVVSSETAAVLTRCWVVLEAALSWKWKKQYDLCLPENGNMQVWRTVADILEKLNLEHCSATDAKDKEMIIRYARAECGCIAALNSMVRELGRRSLKDSEMITAAAVGDVEYLRKVDSTVLSCWRNVSGMTLLHVAAKTNSVSTTVDILSRIGHAQLNEMDHGGRTPMSVAAQNGSLGILTVLISSRAGIHVSSAVHAMTPLHFAASTGQHGAASALLEAEADIEAECQYLGAPRRALHIAAREGHVKFACELLLWGVDIHGAASDGTLALFLASRKGHSDVVAKLIGAKAVVNAHQPDEFRRTALMAAILKGSAPATSLLIAALANPSAKDAKGRSCFDYLSSMDEEDDGTMEFLLKHASRRTQSSAYYPVL